MKFKVAVDNGNSEQDIIIEQVIIAQPNVYARTTLPNLDEVNVEYVMKNIHDNLIASVDGSIYFIGAYALHSGQRCRSIEVGVDNNKVTSNIVYVNTLAHIAAEAVVINYFGKKNMDREIRVDVDMATALPVSYYSKALALQFANKFMGKDHIVIIYAGSNEYSVRVHFDFVKVIPEGVTAAHALTCHAAFFQTYNKTHEKQISTETMRNARVLHVAIGEGTTEFPITSNGIQFNPNFITGTNNGIGHAIDRVIQDFKKIYGLLKFTRQDFSNILCDSSHRYHDTAMDIIAPALDDEAEEILTMTKEVILQANNEVDFVVVYGGGSILLRTALESRLQKFCDRAKINLLYIDKEQAVLLEAFGLNYFVHSSLFEEIKKVSA